MDEFGIRETDYLPEEDEEQNREYTLFGYIKPVIIDCFECILAAVAITAAVTVSLPCGLLTAIMVLIQLIPNRAYDILCMYYAEMYRTAAVILGLWSITTFIGFWLCNYCSKQYPEFILHLHLLSASYFIMLVMESYINGTMYGPIPNFFRSGTKFCGILAATLAIYITASNEKKIVGLFFS